MEERKGRVSYVIGPDGSPLTLADLPPPSTRRWVSRRKAQVVAAVRGGLLTLDEACHRYMLTAEEFLAWQDVLDRFGVVGLKATRVQQYRNKREAIIPLAEGTSVSSMRGRPPDEMPTF